MQLPKKAGSLMLTENPPQDLKEALAMKDPDGHREEVNWQSLVVELHEDCHDWYPEKQVAIMKAIMNTDV